MTCLGPPAPGLRDRASRLALLRLAGLQVPDFIVVDVFCSDSEIVSAVKSIGGPPYVLRSLTPGDLGPSRAPAFVASLEGLLQALRLWGQSAVVQKAINAVASGFAYTISPVDGDPTLVYVDSVVGLGLRLSEEGAPHDEFRVLRDGLKVYDVRVMAKQRAQLIDVNGVVERSLDDPEAQSITDEEAVSIASAALAAERAAGVPVELSWAIDGARRLWALGLRPLQLPGSRS